MTIKTNNEEWGFFGTCRSNGANADLEWTKAIAVLEGLDLTAEVARDVLDSTFGRHVADQVTSGVDLADLLKRWNKDFRRTVALVTAK
ncbi:hypothetical protein P9A44_gp14 [Xanthomonas phage vB_Xar_IVIA-DoCa5]|uniref:Uncharacterized protein n=1 Tax=Xanthomonas phage vB_Xar_IVIA-DoCa5 TaxID=2975532 RepID=A0A9X9JN44_9CAUD|nr:hypothetical protein P9A44_gp14 [Xanthomonas phage vB_Xar_IVIA-DoCa5]UYA98684.1 hypothetical protein IVIADoCa5_14 [Xanthomonas phage vB_Xar_IVIA-DoCa5]